MILRYCDQDLLAKYVAAGWIVVGPYADRSEYNVFVVMCYCDCIDPGRNGKLRK